MFEKYKKKYSESIVVIFIVVPLMTLFVTELAATVKDKPLADHVQNQHTVMLEQILNQQGGIITNQAVMKHDLNILNKEVNILRGIK